DALRVGAFWVLSGVGVSRSGQAAYRQRHSKMIVSKVHVASPMSLAILAQHSPCRTFVQGPRVGAFSCLDRTVTLLPRSLAFLLCILVLGFLSTPLLAQAAAIELS